MKDAKIERAIVKLITKSPLSPKDIVEAMTADGFDAEGVRDAIWQMLDSHSVEVTPDRRLEPAGTKVARAS